MQVAHQSIDGEGCHKDTGLFHQQAVERVIMTMRAHLHEPLSLQDMADIAHLSPYHFHRVFHRIIGIPPGEFLAAVRLYAAKRLLLTTSMSVTDICFEVGYSSLGSFTTRFTQLVGLAPGRLRQQVEHFEKLTLDTLHPQRFVFCHFPLYNCFFGRIHCSDMFSGLIYIGLFPRPIPQGRPVRWISLMQPGPYLIPSVPDGGYYALAVAFPAADHPQTYLLPDQRALVGMTQEPVLMQQGKMIGQQDIALRFPRLQ